MGEQRNGDGRWAPQLAGLRRAENLGRWAQTFVYDPLVERSCSIRIPQLTHGPQQRAKTTSRNSMPHTVYDTFARGALRVRTGLHPLPDRRLPARRAARRRLPADLDRHRLRQTRPPPGLGRLPGPPARRRRTRRHPTLADGRSVRHLAEIAALLAERGVDLIVLKQGIDTTTPAGRFLFHVIGAMDEMQADIISEGTLEGLEAARARGPHRRAQTQTHPGMLPPARVDGEWRRTHRPDAPSKISCLWTRHSHPALCTVFSIAQERDPEAREIMDCP